MGEKNKGLKVTKVMSKKYNLSIIKSLNLPSNLNGAHGTAISLSKSVEKKEVKNNS